MHKPGESWNEREIRNATLTVEALCEAADAITSTIRNHPTSSHDNRGKAEVLQRISKELGQVFNTDIDGNATLSERHNQHIKPPTTLGEMQKRLTHVRNSFSDDQQQQEICEAASQAAVKAVSKTMTASKGPHHR